MGPSSSPGTSPHVTWRPSRIARRFAVLTRMRYTHVLRDDLASNDPMLWITASHVSCTTSSAEAGDETMDRATRVMPPDQASSISANAAESWSRNRASHGSSGRSPIIDHDVTPVS